MILEYAALRLCMCFVAVVSSASTSAAVGTTTQPGTTAPPVTTPPPGLPSAP